MRLTVDQKVARVAGRQYDLITCRDLGELGISRGAVVTRVRNGRWVRVHVGVYGVGTRPKDPAAIAKAAVLACGRGAALSHSSAAFLWGLRKHLQRPVEVTVPGNRAPAGIRVHRSPSLLAKDFRTHRGIRATIPARTVLDWAPRLTDKQLARAVNDARLDKYARLTVPQLAGVLPRFPRHPGTKRLQPFIEDPNQEPTRSELEDAFLAFTAEYDLPTPRTNVIVAGHLVDAFFPDHNLIVELDSVEFHSGEYAFENDRDRDATTLASGHPTVRITWERMMDRPGREATRLRKILDDRVR